MTLSHFSSRLGAMVGAVLISFTLVFVAPQAHAAKRDANFYNIELIQNNPIEKQRVKGVTVKCTDGECTAPLASTAHKNMCIAVVKQFGAVKSFGAGGRQFDDQEISSCNAKGGAAEQPDLAKAR